MPDLLLVLPIDYAQKARRLTSLLFARCCRPLMLSLPPLLLLAACGSGDPAGVPGDADDQKPFSDVPDDAAIRFTGTEPFWGGRVAGGVLTWSTPENIDGVEIPVSRFAGRGGLSFSGTLEGQSFDLAITPGACSDGMSDRSYRYVATASIGGAVREGCAWVEGEEPEGVN